jgi:hypothetical protein
MRPFKVTALLLALLPALAVAQKKPKPPNVPAAVGLARFVFVEAANGQEFDPNLGSADRLAIADLRDALKAWGRYTLTPEREKADLIFVIRKGQPARGNARGGSDDSDPQWGQPGGQFPQAGGEFPGQQRGRVPDVGTIGDTGLEADMLEVSQLDVNGKLTRPLWVRTFANGLNGPRLILFEQFKDEVEKAYPASPVKP